MDKPSVFEDRETEEYLAHHHDERVETLGDWKDRIEKARLLVNGNIPYVNPDGVVVSDDIQITNLADAMPRDTARLVSEIEPDYKAPILAQEEKADLNAEVRAAVGKQYMTANRFDLLRPYLSMDLDLSGTCFVCAWVDPGRMFPRYERIDPMFAYPDTYNGRLVDLLVIQQMKLRTAQMVFPSFDWSVFSRMQLTDDVTIMDYYGPQYNATAVGRTGTDGGRMDPGQTHLLAKMEHGCDRPTVGFAMLPSPTGEFRGSLDQIGKPMATKNRLVSLITEYAHEAIYAPWEERGIMNWQEDPGPDTRYHHNSQLDGETFMRRIAPAAFNGELFGLLNFMETEQRGQLGYPLSRQGDAGVSQGSASYVTATQGQLQSIVRERQRLLSTVQEDLIAVSFQLEKNWMDFEKSLPVAIGKKKSYTPSKDIGLNYEVTVSYGAGAGLDVLNADQRLINFYTTGVLSGEMVLEQTNFVENPRGEMERRENEEITRILLEKWLSTPEVTPELIGMTLTIKKERGISLAEAWAEVQSALAEAQQREQQAAAEEEAQASAAPLAGAPPTSVAPQPTPEFAKTPMHQVISGG
jgi:hypothetical protein